MIRPTLSRGHVVGEAADPHLGCVVLVRSESWILLCEKVSKFKKCSGLVKIS